MQSFDIVTLRVFLAVARLGSIGAAARSEHIATSAASRRISELENDLDTILVSRTPTGASLTPAGKVFAGHCEQLLHKYSDVRADLKRFAEGEAGDFRIAVIPWAMNGSLPSIIAQFKQAYPSVHVTVQEIFSRDAARFLREDLADLCIVYDTGDLAGFEKLVFKEDFVWVVGSADHPLFATREEGAPIHFRETFEYEHISLLEGGALDEILEEVRRKAGQSSKPDIKVMRVSSLIHCVRAGLGLGILGEKDLRPHLDDETLKAAPLADKWALRHVYSVFPKGQKCSPALNSFLQHLNLRPPVRS